MSHETKESPIDTLSTHIQNKDTKGILNVYIPNQHYHTEWEMEILTTVYNFLPYLLEGASVTNLSNLAALFAGTPFKDAYNLVVEKINKIIKTPIGSS
jgi:hypothetical protein